MTSRQNDDDRPLESLLLYTHNVARVLKPSQDGELAHAIHETLHYALDGDARDFLMPLHSPNDPCLENGYDDDQQQTDSSSFGRPLVRTASTSYVSPDGKHVQPGFYPTSDPERPFVSYEWDKQSGRLTLPHPRTVLNPLLNDKCSAPEIGQDPRDAFDVTAKFFYLQDSTDAQKQSHFPPEWINDALQSFKVATGLDSVDVMLLAFPSLKLDCPKAKDEAMRQKAAKVVELWRGIETSKKMLSLGLSDVSKRSLAMIVELLSLPACKDFYAQQNQAQAAGDAQLEMSMVHKQPASNGSLESEGPIRIPSSPSQVSLGDTRTDEQQEITKVYGPGPCRRPRLCTINLREQHCDEDSLGGQSISKTHNASSTCWDRGLADLCKQENILLVAHNDQKDILPARTLPTLFAEFQDRIPHALPVGRKRLEPVWCMKYTILIRDRGVLADKGFVLFCRSVDVKETSL